MLTNFAVDQKTFACFESFASFASFADRRPLQRDYRGPARGGANAQAAAGDPGRTRRVREGRESRKDAVEGLMRGGTSTSLAARAALSANGET